MLLIHNSVNSQICLIRGGTVEAGLRGTTPHALRPNNRPQGTTIRRLHCSSAAEWSITTDFVLPVGKRQFASSRSGLRKCIAVHDE
jgi:hypothetical protein